METEVCEKQLPTVYNEDFRKEVLAHFEKFGNAATCRKFQVASATIYHWQRNGIKSKLKYRYSEETRRQVVELASKCGGRAAAKAYGLNQPLVARWVLLDKGEKEKAGAGDAKEENVEEGRKKAD